MPTQQSAGGTRSGYIKTWLGYSELMRNDSCVAEVTYQLITIAEPSGTRRTTGTIQTIGGNPIPGPYTNLTIDLGRDNRKAELVILGTRGPGEYEIQIEAT